MIKPSAMFADVAELVDALDLGSSVFDVWVRVPPSASTINLLLETLSPNIKNT